MWPFRKNRSFVETCFFKDYTDFHSHILPGVDDGVPAMEKSLHILEFYEQIGIRAVWLTPHIMEDMPNTTEQLKSRFSELKTHYKGPIELRLAAEYMLDNLFEERLTQNDLLPLGQNHDHLLVETSYFNAPMNLYDTMERIKARGYHPVLAHPERYVYMGASDYARLKKMGVRFQLNLPSLIGMYGNVVKAKANSLLKDGFYNLAGTDLHNEETIHHLASASLTSKQSKAINDLRESSIFLQ